MLKLLQKSIEYEIKCKNSLLVKSFIESYPNAKFSCKNSLLVVEAVIEHCEMWNSFVLNFISCWESYRKLSNARFSGRHFLSDKIGTEGYRMLNLVTGIFI